VDQVKTAAWREANRDRWEMFERLARPPKKLEQHESSLSSSMGYTGYEYRWAEGGSVPRLFRAIAALVLCCAMSGSICAAGGELNLPSIWQRFAEVKQHTETEVKKEASRSQAAKRQTLLKHRVEQLRKSGKQAAAIPMAQRSLALTERRHGREHPNVATARNTLGHRAGV
jgi:hypothetical protein